MKAILEFDLPEDTWLHEACLKGPITLSALTDFGEFLFNLYDEGSFPTPEAREVVEEVWGRWKECISEVNGS